MVEQGDPGTTVFLSGQSGRLSAAPAHGSPGSSMPSCFAPVSALGFPPQRGGGGEGRTGVSEEGVKDRQEGEKKGRRRRKRRSTGEEERKDVA